MWEPWGVGVCLSRVWIPQGDFLEEVATQKTVYMHSKGPGRANDRHRARVGARKTHLLFTHRIFFLIKCVYLAIDGNLQTQALVNITISDLLLASYLAAPGISPSMEEETEAERGVVPLLGPQSWEVEALGFDPRRLTTTVDSRNALGCSHLAGGNPPADAGHLHLLRSSLTQLSNPFSIHLFLLPLNIHYIFYFYCHR